MAEPQKRPGEHMPAAPAAGGIAARALAQARGGLAYLDDLNPEQRLAVETLDGPVLVLAGAGTGKTRVLTTRIAHIINLGRAHPREILAVTFTNKAAREMKNRIGAMMGQVVEGMPWLGTFHAIGVKILRASCRAGRPEERLHDSGCRRSGAAAQATARSREYRREALARPRAGLDDRRLEKSRADAASRCRRAKPAPSPTDAGKQLYAAYQERLKILNAVDFGDLLMENIRLFREHPDVLADYQRRFKYILVDEYQDTNVAQYLWLRLLAQAPSARAPGLALETHRGAGHRRFAWTRWRCSSG